MIVVATLPAPLSNSQNLAKDQALAALPSVGGGPAIREPINKTSYSSHRIQLWMPAPLSNSQNLAKDQALAALPSVGGGPAIREPINKTSYSSHRIQLWM